jgi:hypothetical protein
VLSLGGIECNESSAIFPDGSPSVREARLGPSEQPSLLLSHQGRATWLSPGT